MTIAESKNIRVLATFAVALPADLADCTDVWKRPVNASWRVLHLPGIGRLLSRLRAIRNSLSILFVSRRYDVVVSTGDLEGLAFAALLRLRSERPIHVMYDCLWYGGGPLRRVWMRFCLHAVDACIVWASVERKRYADAYGIAQAKFVYVPYHHTLDHYSVDVADDGYVFTGGNADRDFGLFLASVADLPLRCVLATNRKQLLRGLFIPDNVSVVSVAPDEFRRLIAHARLVVMPMRANLLHAGAQQTILNAMLLGKPVILTDPEGGADYITNGENGLLVPYGDAGALRDAILWLWTNTGLANRIGKKAQQSAESLTMQRTNEITWRYALSLLRARSNSDGSSRTACGEAMAGRR